ncbi:MFS transporter [Nocardioides sp. NPDC058538]|uniref:MFS transporter n=1 Tax=Nocardioides sp. NPDC058538 TaxID=3346542 RepID=UPI003653FC09
MSSSSPAPESPRVITALHGGVGMLVAVWGAGLPVLDARVDLGPTRLGLLLLTLALGAAIAMPLAGHLAHRWSEAAVLRVALPTAGLLLATIGAMPAAEPMIALAAVFGICCGAINVGLTSQATAAERAAGRPVIARMHGCWTLGAVLGSSALAAALRVGADSLLLLPAAALGAGALVTLLALRLPVGTGTAPGTAAAPNAAAAQGPARGVSPVLVGAGAVAAAAFVVEGAATDWAGVHTTRVLGEEPAAGATMYAAFFAAMTVVRFAGDRLRGAFAAPTLVAAAAGVTLLGFVLVLLSPVAAEGAQVVVAAGGWALAGAGTALVWPIVIGSLGATRIDPRRLSVVTTIGYLGGFVGPVLIGGLAAGVGLAGAMVLPATLTVLLAAAAPPLVARLLPGADPTTSSPIPTPRRTPCTHPP